MRSQANDFSRLFGELGLASRIKRLSDLWMAEVEAVYSRAGLDFEPRWFPVFQLLLDDSPITVTEVAEGLEMTHPHVSLLVKEMTKAKLVSFASNPEDGRSRLLGLTPTGRDLAKRMAPIWEALRQGVAELVNEKDTHFVASLERLEAAFKTQSLADLVQRRVGKSTVRKVRFVSFTPTLREQYEELSREWIERHFSVEPIDLEYFADPKSTVLDQGGQIFFAELDGEVVGTCSLLNEGPTWELGKLAVTRAARGQGVGEQLVREALRRAAKAKQGKLMLVSNSQLVPATRLFEKVGFIAVRRGRSDKYRRGDVIMEKALP